MSIATAFPEVGQQTTRLRYSDSSSPVCASSYSHCAGLPDTEPRRLVGRPGLCSSSRDRMRREVDAPGPIWELYNDNTRMADGNEQ